VRAKHFDCQGACRPNACTCCCARQQNYGRGLFVRSCWLIDLPQHTPPDVAAGVGVLRTGELAARKRDEHGRVLAVAAIPVAELLDQIALFQLDADRNVAGDRHREQQMTNSHRRRRTDGEQDAERSGETSDRRIDAAQL
jgi:hypothetical protein